MQTDTSHAASDVFAANRAIGSVAFDVHLADGVTRRRHLHESGSLRVRFPSPEAQGLSAVFVNTAGGVAGGLVGHSVIGGGIAGTALGAVGGAVAGRAIDRASTAPPRALAFLRC